MTITIEREQPKPQPEPPITRVVLELTAEEWHDLRHLAAVRQKAELTGSFWEAREQAAKEVGLTRGGCQTHDIYGLCKRILTT